MSRAGARRFLLALCLVLPFAAQAAAQPQAPLRNVTAAQAHAMWRAAPGKVFVVDVRTPEEYAQGHPPMAANVPVLMRPAGAPFAPPTENPRFVEQVRRRHKPTDTLLIICRTGNRSQLAVRLLAGAGFSDLYNVADGVEGRAAPPPGGPPAIGWRNAGLPWTTDLDEKLVYNP